MGVHTYEGMKHHARKITRASSGKLVDTVTSSESAARELFCPAPVITVYVRFHKDCSHSDDHFRRTSLRFHLRAFPNGFEPRKRVNNASFEALGEEYRRPKKLQLDDSPFQSDGRSVSSVVRAQFGKNTFDPALD